MSDRQISIAIDAMGGESSPLKAILGSEIFYQSNTGVKLVFFGDEKKNIKNNKIKKNTH